MKKILFFDIKKAFTIAEILITLGIIGIISTMIIPPLMQKSYEKVATAKLKKAYTALSSAYLYAMQENGTPDAWDLKGRYDPVGTENLLNIMVPYLKVNKNCGRGKGCFPPGNYLFLSGGPYQDFDALGTLGKVMLADGTLLAFGVRNEDCQGVRGDGDSLYLKNVCAVVFVDINGFAPPNKAGVDGFWFSISKYGILPHGTAEETGSATEDAYPFYISCNRKTGCGRGCTAWVIYNENMDYLHCDDLSWTGKHKCD